MKIHLALLTLILIFTFSGCGTWSGNGPLRVSESNPRYFTDDSGRAVYLTGSHTWNNLVELESEREEGPFDYDQYLQFLKDHDHTFIRLWAWDLLEWNTKANQTGGLIYSVHPKPWLRTGPEVALDGNPKFDLTQFNPAYFERLRDRVKKAAKENIYVSIMLFDGWGVQFSADAFVNHPFHPSNNVNGLELATGENADGLKIYELGNKRVLELQELYVRKVVEAVNAYDNVLYEISNENHSDSTGWQYHMIRYVKDLEKSMGKSHPVGMTFQHKGGENATLLESPADWISPNPSGGYKVDPPPNDGQKVILTDTDHLWGIGGNRIWIWKSFMSGLNPLFMDPYDHSVLDVGEGKEWEEEMNTALGNTKQMADSMDLIHMIPSATIASSGYCLFAKGKEYLVYLPDGGDVEIDLTGDSGMFEAMWIDPVTMAISSTDFMEGGSVYRLMAPPDNGDMLLHLKTE